MMPLQVLSSITELSILSSIINATGLGADFSNTLLQASKQKWPAFQAVAPPAYLCYRPETKRRLWLTYITMLLCNAQATVFAPSNEAFLRIFPEAVLNRLLSGAASATSPLQALVLLHSVPSPVYLNVREHMGCCDVIHTL